MTSPKTPKMLAAERHMGGPMEKWLAPAVTETGASTVARKLDVSPQLLQHWMKKCRIETHMVALGPADNMEITRAKMEDAD